MQQQPQQHLTLLPEAQINSHITGLEASVPWIQGPACQDLLDARRFAVVGFRMQCLWAPKGTNSTYLATLMMIQILHYK